MSKLSTFLLLLIATLTLSDASYPQTASVGFENRRTISQPECRNGGKSPVYQFVASQGISEFVSFVNGKAKCGYRLIRLTKYPLGGQEPFGEMRLLGVLKYDARAHYEYDWFEAFTPGQAQTRINLRAEAGFYFFKMLPFIQGLDSSRSLSSSEETDVTRVLEKVLEPISFTIGAIYIVERSNAEAKKREYRVLVGTFGGSKRATSELKAELNGKVRDGFRPIAMGPFKILNRHAVSLLVERELGALQKSSEGKFEIVISESGFEKKVNQLSKRGYLLLFHGSLAAQRFAIMSKENNTPAEYEWTNSASFPKLEKFLGKVKPDIRYHSVGFLTYGSDYAENRMVFEKFEHENYSVSEMRFVKLNEGLSSSADSIGRVASVSSLSSKSMDEFGRLLEEGYVFRDLFFSNGVYGLFERSKSRQSGV